MGQKIHRGRTQIVALVHTTILEAKKPRYPRK